MIFNRMPSKPVCVPGTVNKLVASSVRPVASHLGISPWQPPESIQGALRALYPESQVLVRARIGRMRERRDSSLKAITGVTMINRRNPDTSDITTTVIKSTFVTEGDTCSAMLHVPEGTGDRQLPGILMVGGWGSVQQALTFSFVNRFVAAGYAVMEFDFPGWGLSGGWPRQDINPWRRVKAASAALAHLKASLRWPRTALWCGARRLAAATSSILRHSIPICRAPSYRYPCWTALRRCVPYPCRDWSGS